MCPNHVFYFFSSLVSHLLISSINKIDVRCLNLKKIMWCLKKCDHFKVNFIEIQLSKLLSDAYPNAVIHF